MSTAYAPESITFTVWPQKKPALIIYASVDNDSHSLGDDEALPKPRPAFDATTPEKKHKYPAKGISTGADAGLLAADP